jgi:hypothetical protein
VGALISQDLLPPTRRACTTLAETLARSVPPSVPNEKAPLRGFVEADDGIRTHDLLHGKQTL